MFTRKSRAALLVALGLTLAVAVPVSAKPRESSRTVFFGSTADGTLATAPGHVYPNGYFDFTAVAKNEGSQTLTHTTFGFGTDAALPGPGGPSLPAGWTIESVVPSVGTCAWDADGALCDLGSLVGRNGTASVYVLVKTTGSGSGIWASLKIAEQVNDNGGNADTFFATSDVAAAAVCNTPAQSKLPASVQVHVEYNTNACGAAQTSKADMNAAGFTSGELKQLSSGPNCRPGGAAVCFGDYTTVDIPLVAGGAVVEWTVTWDPSILSRNFKMSRLGVIHFPDSGPAVKIDASNACTDATDVDCTVASGINADGDVFMVFRTNENGAAKGYG